MPRKNCQNCKTGRIEYRVYFDHGGPVQPEGSCYANLKTLKAAQICQPCAVDAVTNGAVFNLRKILRADLKTKRASLPKSERRQSASVCAACGLMRPLNVARLCEECAEPGSAGGAALVSRLDDGRDPDLGF
jgi:hypothetical protein